MIDQLARIVDTATHQCLIGFWPLPEPDQVFFLGSWGLEKASKANGTD
jgi:hypothetical protein